LRQPLLRGATMRRREAGEKKAEESKYLKHLTAPEQASIVGAYGKTGLSSLGERGAAANVLSMVTSEKGQKERTEAKTAELLKEKRFSEMEDQGEAKRLAGMEAKDNIRKGSGELMKQGQDLAQRNNDFDAVEKFKDQLAKDPQLSGSAEEIQKQMEKMRNDPEKLNGMSKDSKQSFAVALNALPTGAMDVDKNGDVQGFDQPSLERFYEQNAGNKELVETVEMAVDHVQKSDGKGVAKDELMSMQKQRMADGTAKLYGKGKDSKGKETGYEQKHNQKYEKSRKGFETAIKNDTSNIDGAKMEEALNSGVELKDIVGMGNTVQKKDMGTHLEASADVAMRNAAVATDKASLDKALEMALPAMSQLDQVDADVQVKILSGIQKGGGAQTISDKWDMADDSQRKAMQKAVKQAVRRAAEISKKRASGATISGEEQAVEQLVTERKEKMPRSKTGTTRAAPVAIRQVLHEGEK